MFPNVAIDTPMSAKDSWQATKNYQLMIFTVVTLFSVFFTGLEWIVSKLGAPSMFITIFAPFTLVLLASALSEAYKIIMAENELQKA